MSSVIRLLVTANIVPGSPILVGRPDYGVNVPPKRRLLQEKHDILHSPRRETIRSYIALTGWTLYWRRSVSPVRHELGFYIPEDDILYTNRREALKSYIALTGSAL
jgi:hypothetical protein